MWCVFDNFYIFQHFFFLKNMNLIRPIKISHVWNFWTPLGACNRQFLDLIIYSLFFVWISSIPLKSLTRPLISINTYVSWQFSNLFMCVPVTQQYCCTAFCFCSSSKPGPKQTILSSEMTKRLITFSGFEFWNLCNSCGC